LYFRCLASETLARLSAQKYGIEFYLCKRECLNDEIVKNTGSECKRIPDLLTSNVFSKQDKKISFYLEPYSDSIITVLERS